MTKSLYINASACEAVQFALTVLESEILDERAKGWITRELRTWLTNPENAGAKLQAKIEQRRKDYQSAGWMSPTEPMQSKHADGLNVTSLSFHDDRVIWFDWYGESITLAASLLAQRLGHPIVLYDLHDSGNGHLSARWKRVLP